MRLRSWWRPALVVIPCLLLTACGGIDPSTIRCLGEPVEVGDHQATVAGVGRSVSDSYVVADLLLTGDDGEKLVIASYRGAAFPADAMNGFTEWQGYRIDLLARNVAPPEGRVGPCGSFAVEKLPPDHVRTTVEPGASGH